MSLNAQAAGDQPLQPTDFKLCVICQRQKKSPVVKNPRPSSFKNLLEKVSQRAEFNDIEYALLNKRLENQSPDSLQKEEAVWHRDCYANLTCADKIERAKDRQKLNKSLFVPQEKGRRSMSADDVDRYSLPATPFTRSATKPLDKNICFFCQEDKPGTQLHSVRSLNAGLKLKEAVQKSSNQELRTRYSTCIADGDAHSQDLKYHKSCWNTNVFHVLRHNPEENGEPEMGKKEVSCLVELLNIIDFQTKQGDYLSMADIEKTYIGLLGGQEGLEKNPHALTRKWLKVRILSELPHLRSVQPNGRNKPSVLYFPEACEKDMVKIALDNPKCETDNLQLIFESAKLIRQRIESHKATNQEEGLIKVTSTPEDVPVELYTLIRWIMTGPAEKLETKVRAAIVDQNALTISQNVMFGYKSKRQVRHIPSNEDAGFRAQQVRENAQTIGLALTLHHDTRNKNLLELLNEQGFCISYLRTLMIETALANAVIEKTKTFQGLYVPPFLKKDTFLFFAVDNTDFAEDTPDGRGTTHGTITAIYQRENITADLVTSPPSIDLTQPTSLSVVPYHTPISQCPKPSHSKYQMKDFKVSSTGVDEHYYLTQLGWVVVSALSRMKNAGKSPIPGWAGYNSLLSSSVPLTEVASFPLLQEIAHDWSTLLTVMKQAIQLKELAVGDKYTTVITFDMALYEKAVQLVDTREELKGKVLPRLGELHVVMCALRALGSSMENSGIDDAWVEADVYSSATVRQILNCTHYKRCLRAHIYSYMALFELLLEQFFSDNNDLLEEVQNVALEVETACKQENKNTKSDSVKNANASLMQNMIEHDFQKRLKEWEGEKSSNAMFRSLMNYLKRVETILLFVAASRNADVNLHLQAGEELSKLFFSMDRLKYKRLWPRYLADMQALKINHPDTWRELQHGNMSVTKSAIPFVSLGPDHACEHLNRMMKVHAGLIGISNNANARQRFFLATPELSLLAKDFKCQFKASSKQKSVHHDLSPAEVNREHAAVSKIKKAIERHGNPFAVEGSSLYNLVTLAYIPEEFVEQILNIDITGQRLYEEFVSERIKGEVSLWAPVKKEKNYMYTSANKKLSAKIRDKNIDMKETKNLYGRLMILARSNRDIDQKHAIGTYEFTLTPRALFSPDGSLLPCTDKSKLIHSLKGIADRHEEENVVQTSDEGEHPKIAVVDGMVVVQKLNIKAAAVKTVRDLSICYNERLMDMTKDYDEVIVVFDTYKHDSLKSKTRERRQKEKSAVQYQVKDGTQIQHITLQKFLSHEETKAQLAEYLAEKIIDYNQNSDKLVITSAGGKTKSNGDLELPNNNHEEADTLMICLGVSSTQRNPSHAHMTFFSPDTDVLVLLISNFESLPMKTFISLNSHVQPIKTIWDALGLQKAKALAGFHSFTGSDNTGRFARIGKQTWFKHFMEAESEVHEALGKICENGDMSEETESILEKFVCSAYSPKGVNITLLPDLRWHLFCKNMAESERLPPTIAALRQHIMRAHVQGRVWGQSAIHHQELLDPTEHGYQREENGQLRPVTTELPAAPDAIVEMASCGCKTNCTTNRCMCMFAKQPCTDMCRCTDLCENDADLHAHVSDDDDDDD